MAEEVIIKFDIGVATNNIARLEAELKKVKQEFKFAETGSKEFYKAQDAGRQLTAQIKSYNDSLKASTNALGGVNSSAKFLSGSLGELKQRLKENKSEIDKVREGGKLYNALFQEQIEIQNKLIAVQKPIPSMFQERIKGAIDEANTLQGLRAEIKKYTDAVIAGEAGAAEKLAELKDKLEDVKDATNTFKGSGVEALTSSMGQLRESITNFDGGKFTTALKGIGGAMKAIPIFLIIEGIKLLVENFDDIFNFAQSFTDSAKEVKKLTKEYEALQVANARNTAVISAAITVQEAELNLMVSQGASNDAILAQEQKIYKSKLDLLKLKATDLKASGLLAIAKKQEILDNDSVYEASIRLQAQIQKKLGNDKVAEIYEALIAKNKKERAEEADKQIQESFNGAIALTAELTALQLNNNAKINTSTIDTANKKIDASRQIRQAEIDNIENVYKRQLAQIKFDEDNALQDLKRSKDFYGKKAQLEKEILEKARQENIAAAREEAIRLEAIANELSQAQIDLIKNDFERNQKQIALNEKIALENAENTIINNAALLFETKKNITAKYADQQRNLSLEYVKKDLLAEQQLIAEQRITLETNLVEVFTAKQNLLKEQRDQELKDFQGTENEKLVLQQEFANKSIEIDIQLAEEKRKIRDETIQIAEQLANSLITVASLTLENGEKTNRQLKETEDRLKTQIVGSAEYLKTQKELADLQKKQQQQQENARRIEAASALTTIAVNTAIAISKGVAASSGIPFPANILAIVTTVATVLSNMAAAKQALTSFEEGGYTGEGPANEVSTNLGSKPYTYHKSEYVIPARVLGTPQGNMLAAQAESMRLGMSNPMPYIGGMFDGGFTARSAGADANNTISNNAMLNQLLGNLPTPVVRVTDINKVQGDSIRVSQTSSL